MDIARYGIDASSYEKTAPVTATLQRAKQSATGADGPSTLTPELSHMKAMLISMSEGRHALFFDFACQAAIHFKDEARVAKELYEVASSDRKLKAKVEPALNSLRKCRLI